ncbi:MAG: deoxyhypusine synthase family protein [Phycisphaeraceae bacterium]|nr:deoxyhypusine synthase family protein [Phycisphaeraceae bacterium]
MNVSEFIEKHYRHFNAAVVVEAARTYGQLIGRGDRMMVTLAGAMSTAELGLSLAEMIRRDKVHAICCTGANLEEDLFNLVAHEHYERIPHYRHLSPQEEKDLLDRHLNRVTDTCIPEEEAMRRIEHAILDLWTEAHAAGHSFFPHEYLYQLILENRVAEHYQIDPADSWLVAAAEKNLPIFVPGWEDSTLGNIFVAHCIAGDLDYPVVKGGTRYMGALARWYLRTTMGQEITAEANSIAQVDDLPANAEPCDPQKRAVGFFQIGGGIAGDFPICVVPMIHQDLRLPCPCWAYFCQISDSTTSYGSYSGAVPNEKITWGKLETDTPRFVIESDATIVAPLIFAHVLGW